LQAHFLLPLFIFNGIGKSKRDCKPTKKKKKFLKMFPRTTKNKKTNRWTVATGHSGHRHGLQESTGYNSGFKKLAVQWLNEVRFSNQTFVQVDSFVLRNHQLLKPEKRYSQCLKTTVLRGQ